MIRAAILALALCIPPACAPSPPKRKAYKPAASWSCLTR